MLIQITNNCTMGCHHCLQDSKIGDYHMSDETFQNALLFGLYLGTFRYNISGGEPTSHPRFMELMEILTDFLGPLNYSVINILSSDIGTIMQPYPSFTIESNGEFIRDKFLVDYIKKLAKHPKMEGIQVCSIKGLYKNYDFISKYKDNILKLSPKIYVRTDGIRAMKDLGRAASNEEYCKQAEDDKWFMSCLNSTLTSKQCGTPEMYSYQLFIHEQTCRPLVDYLGYVHMSESMWCSNVGNVNTDSFSDIWENMKNFKPCGKCSGYKKFVNSDKPNITVLKNIIGL